MPRSILNLTLEKELNGLIDSTVQLRENHPVNLTTDVLNDDVNNQVSIDNSCPVSPSSSEAKANSTSSFGVFSESQLRDITEVLEVQSRSLICPSSTNANSEDEVNESPSIKNKTTIDSSGNGSGSSARSNINDGSQIKTDESNGNTINQQQLPGGVESDHHQEEIRSASGLGESCSNSCYSTSSSSLPGNSSDIRENDTEAHSHHHHQPSSPSSSSSSPSSPSSATVTVSTCPSCGSENVDPCLKSSSFHRRYSTESFHPQPGHPTTKWKSYTRPEITSKSAHRSSPYKIKSHCNNSSSFKQPSSRHHHNHSHHHHHHGHHHGHHRLMTRSSSKKHSSLASELDLVRGKTKTKRDRYCSKLSSNRYTSNDLRGNGNGRCHVCKYDEDNRLTGLHSSVGTGTSGLGRSSKGDCPYSLSYDDDHMMSHLCDIDSWHRRRKRETLKKKERAIIAILSIVAVLIFIAMSYFGTILFLRITTMPVS